MYWYIADIPILTGISVIQNDTAIAISWNGAYAKIYIVSLTRRFDNDHGVTTSTISIHTTENQHIFHGITSNISHITVIPGNFICQGEGMRLAWSSATGNFVGITLIYICMRIKQ